MLKNKPTATKVQYQIAVEIPDQVLTLIILTIELNST